MLLSWWVLKTRYGLVHYVAVCICLLGVGAMVGADLLAGRDQGSSKNPTVTLSSCDVFLLRKEPVIHQNAKLPSHTDQEFPVVNRH